MYIHIHTYLYLYISELHGMFEVGHVGYVIQKQSNQLDCNYQSRMLARPPATSTICYSKTWTGKAGHVLMAH